MPIAALSFDVPPYRLSGTVYGALLNHSSALAALGPAVHESPYKAPPRAPVLNVKPRNTLSFDGEPVTVPADAEELEVGANLGIVIGRIACRLCEANALECVAGFIIVNDVSVPVESHYRPNVRQRARDGFCPLGPRVVTRSSVPDPDSLGIRVYVDGRLNASSNTSGLIRKVATLLVDVTDFMTLAPGDILAAGAAAPAPRVRAGQEVRIEIDSLGSLTNSFVRPAA
jgi:5-oxopent-3-ene-1,2,5-tricarboxylate decarboxylase/2-hydroxyhepta-2,4-diene-1,7-dioate isomerase